MRHLIGWYPGFGTTPPSNLCFPKAPPLPQGLLGTLVLLWKTGTYLDLILRVVDHKSVGQGVLGERREVGLGQQGLQSSKHLLLIRQTLGVCQRRLVKGLPVGVDGVIQGLKEDRREEKQAGLQQEGSWVYLRMLLAPSFTRRVPRGLIRGPVPFSFFGLALSCLAILRHHR